MPRKVRQTFPAFTAIILSVILATQTFGVDQIVVVPTSETAPQLWQYTTVNPGDDWNKTDFDSSAWKTAPAPFGQGFTGINTAWTDTPGDIWMRRVVNLPQNIPAKLVVLAKHDEGVEVYVNGLQAASAGDYVKEYVPLMMSDDARAALKPGAPNLIAVHCHQSAGGQVIDVGISEALVAKPTVVPWQSDSTTVAWKSSTAGQLWHDNDPLPVTSSDKADVPHIVVDPTANYQSIDAWGGCFNERGWAAMSPLDAATRESILRAFFDAKTGLKLTVGRSPIGASDYAIAPYSLDDTAGDYDITHFSITRDKQKLIPYIKAAMAVQPKLRVWGVPWSPPAWMKDNNSMVGGGHIKTDVQTMTALALYFEKYVKAYQSQGIPVFMVMPQNEPSEQTSYPSCAWSGTELRDFVGQYLGPKFRADNVNTQIWMGTFTNSNWEYVLPTISDPQAMSFIKGFGFQWSGDGSAIRLNGLLPSLKLMQSETECGNHANDWGYAEGQFRIIQKYELAGVSSYMLWNMVLDEVGSNWTSKPDGIGWQQSSPVIVDQKTGQVTYNPQYYVFKHFSYFVQPGAHCVEVDGNWGEKVAFRNADGELVLVIQNSSSSPFQVSLNLGGKKISPMLQAHSCNTFTLPGVTPK